jgi:hypothetical protein
MDSIPAWCEWLEGTSIGLMVRESAWGFPILVAIHIMAISFSVGLLFWFDLRLLGITLQRWPVSAFYRRLAPFMLTAFVVMAVSGAMLFTGFATKAYPNVFFRIKIAAMMLGAVNALIFHFVTELRMARWDQSAATPPSARVAGATSILVWTITILAGRLMAYTMYSN